ncbi:MAG: HAD family hydrolase, partial [Alphaproteobacteria bacterium]|nr:HAD family hydrolase [Alphaproteobacteria bacterium]
MNPLASISDQALRGVKGVFTDIDDTLTTEGSLTAAAYGALERLHESGLMV